MHKAIVNFAASIAAAVIFTSCTTPPQDTDGPRESLVVAGSLDPEFTPSWSSSGQRVLQYSRMTWAPGGGKVAASVLQGPYAIVVAEDHRQARFFQVSTRGSDLAVAWLSDSSALLVEGLDIGAGGEPRRTWYASRVNELRSLSGTRRRPESVAARALRLPTGDQGFIAIEATGVVGVDRAPPLVVRTADGTEQQHFDPFPADGASRQVIAADFQQAGGRVVMIAGVLRVTRPGGANSAGQWIDPISGHDIEVVDVFSKKPLCRLTFDDARAGVHAESLDFHGVALSPDTKRFVINTLKGATLYEVDGCRPLLRLRDDRDAGGASGRWISFSGDGRYVIRDGADVRSVGGGFLDIWRVADAQHVVHLDTDVHDALAVKPGTAEFAVGRADGRITFFRIQGGF